MFAQKGRGLQPPINALLGPDQQHIHGYPVLALTRVALHVGGKGLAVD
jgi:hypothetical protein